MRSASRFKLIATLDCPLECHRQFEERRFRIDQKVNALAPRGLPGRQRFAVSDRDQSEIFAELRNQRTWRRHCMRNEVSRDLRLSSTAFECAMFRGARQSKAEIASDELRGANQSLPIGD
jgi:hypothetical protein